MSVFIANRLKRITEPVLRLLRRGASPNRLAASFALGAAIGLFPVVGVTTALCAAVAVRFRLNLPIIQLANYLVYPLQLALLVPFAHLGAALFQAPPPPVTADELVAFFSEDFSGAIVSFSTVIAHAVAAWTATALPVCAGVFIGLSVVFRRLVRRRETSQDADRLPTSAG